MSFDKAAYWATRNRQLSSDPLVAEQARIERRDSKLRTVQVVQCKRCKSTSGTLVNKTWLCNRCPGTSA